MLTRKGQDLLALAALLLMLAVGGAFAVIRVHYSALMMMAVMSSSCGPCWVKDRVSA